MATRVLIQKPTYHVDLQILRHHPRLRANTFATKYIHPQTSELAANTHSGLRSPRRIKPVPIAAGELAHLRKGRIVSAAS